MFNKIRTLSKRSPFLRRLVGYHLASSGLFDGVFRNYRLSEHWQRRVRDVVSCPDNASIPRCAQAGRIQGGIQYLHNGLKIHLGSYYGPEYARLLEESRGVHEPQEEKVFAEVLKVVAPGSVMIELGAFWSFYSMWFQQEVQGARNFMLEPDAFNLGHGRRNFRLNRMTGVFVQAYAGAASDYGGAVPTLCIDDFAVQQQLDFIHVLHSDIQGFEYEMLNGASRCFAEHKIGYVFLSTHSNEVHEQCRRFLADRNFVLLADADLDDTYSEDGLLVGRASFLTQPGPVPIALKTVSSPVNTGHDG